MFLLKETVNCPGDFRKISNEGPWSEIGYMNYFLQNTTKTHIPDFGEIKDNKVDWERYAMMTSIVNLKKITGKSTSAPEEIYNYALRDKDFILKEIRIIQPEVIVCGMTFDIFTSALGLKNQKLADRIYRNQMLNDALIIDHVHPSQRTRKDMVYYTLSAYYKKSL